VLPHTWVCLTSQIQFSRAYSEGKYPEEEEYTPGFFFILELGVFILLDRHTSINFSGLRRHGGTPPLCSPNPVNGKPAKLYKFAYRFVLIFYVEQDGIKGNTCSTFPSLNIRSLGNTIKSSLVYHTIV
jgi:hypothetical protein